MLAFSQRADETISTFFLKKKVCKEYLPLARSFLEIKSSEVWASAISLRTSGCISQKDHAMIDFRRKLRSCGKASAW
jgi:hypothetical protein